MERCAMVEKKVRNLRFSFDACSINLDRSSSRINITHPFMSNSRAPALRLNYTRPPQSFLGKEVRPRKRQGIGQNR